MKKEPVANQKDKVGKKISHKAALEIARKILLRAERERRNQK